MKLRGLVIIITGGTGGIGSVISQFFTKEGARVVVFRHDNNALKNKGFYVDVSDYGSVRRGVRRVLRKFGHIDGIVNCAGVQAPIGPFIENDMAMWRKNVNVNLLGTVYMCHAAAPSMAKRKKGFIINFSGGGASSSRPNFSAYAVAKTGVVRFTEVLAEELASCHVRVNAIAPGAVNTRMLEEVLRVGKWAGKKELDASVRRAKESGTPPERAAELAVFLASKDSAGLSGRLVSAVWDDWKHWDKKNIGKIMAGESLTLRRAK